MNTHVTILLGGLWGWDGYATSRGMIVLSDQLSKLPTITTTIYTWDKWQEASGVIADDIGNKHVVIGYSGGGSRATWLANFHVPAIDLMILYDPSPKWQMKPIHDNVFSAMCYQNSSPSFFGLGGGVLTGTTKIGTRVISENHLIVQWDQKLHATTIDLVKNLIGDVP